MSAPFVRLTVLAALGAATAQDLGIKSASQSRTIVIENVDLHIGDGSVLPGGTIWFSGGRIEGIRQNGAEAALLPDAERIDGTGLSVYPGLVGANTTIGLSEIGSVRATQDYDEIGDITPEVWAAVAINPDSTAIPIARSNGVLTVGVLPQGGLVPGRLSVVQLEGWTWEEMTILADAGIVVDWPAMPARRSRQTAAEHDKAVERTREQRADIEAAFRDARAWLDARTADTTVPTDVRHAAMGPALRRERPVFVRAEDAEQIRSAIAWAIDLGLRPTILGGRDAEMCLDLIRLHGVPIVVDGVHRLPSRRDSPFDAPFRLPATLEAAGIRWCLATGGGFANERNLPYEAATAIAHGLSPAAALRAVTLSAAELLGVGERLGSLAEGKLATLLVCDRSPLEATAVIHAAFIAGRRIDLRNRQTHLADKYRTRYRQLGLLPAAGK